MFRSRINPFSTSAFSVARREPYDKRRVRPPKLVTLCAAVIGLTLIWARPAAGLGSCTISTTRGGAFGSLDALSSTPVDSPGLLHVACTLTGLLITVDLNKGNAPTYNPRF